MKLENNINISLTNDKLGSAIPSLNLPAGKTCRSDAPCKHGCYALKGNWLFKNVIESLENNLKSFLEDDKRFFKTIKDFLKQYKIF